VVRSSSDRQSRAVSRSWGRPACPPPVPPLPIRRISSLFSHDYPRRCFSCWAVRRRRDVAILPFVVSDLAPIIQNRETPVPSGQLPYPHASRKNNSGPPKPAKLNSLVLLRGMDKLWESRTLSSARRETNSPYRHNPGMDIYQDAPARAKTSRPSSVLTHSM
jgi:hypothetical protein